MAATCRVLCRAFAASVPSFIIVRPPRLRVYAGMLVQATVPGDGICCRWPRRLWVALGGGSGWTCVQSNDYWSGTEITPGNNAWNFNPDNGNQNNDNENNPFFAVAVRSGG